MTIKTYTVTSSPNCQLLSTLFCPHLLHPLQICSTHSKFAPPAHFRHQAHVSTFSSMQHKSIAFANTNKYPLQIFSTSTPLAHSPHPLHPLIHSIRQRRKNAHETVFISASPSTVPVFKFKFLYNAPHQETNVCILRCVSNFFAHENKTCSEKYEWTSLLLLSEISISVLPSHSCLHVQELHTTQTDIHTHTHTLTHTHTHTHTHTIFNHSNVHICNSYYPG